jgi:mRNA interferase MazF
VALTDWLQAGLKTASTARLSRLDCLEQSLLKSRIGVIAPSDAKAIRQIWDSYIHPQF